MSDLCRMNFKIPRMMEMWHRSFFLLCVFWACSNLSAAQTNTGPIRIEGYYRGDGAFVKPYFRTAPNLEGSGRFVSRPNGSVYAGTPGWMTPGSKYNTLYYTESPPAPSPIPLFQDRIYIQDEFGVFNTYLKQEDSRTYKVYNLADQQVLYLSVTHEEEWRIYDLDGRMIKVLFLAE